MMSVPTHVLETTRNHVKSRHRLVSHRLAHVTGDDRILFCQDGVVMEDGKHSELSVKPGGLYADLIKSIEVDDD